MVCETILRSRLEKIFRTDLEMLFNFEILMFVFFSLSFILSGKRSFIRYLNKEPQDELFPGNMQSHWTFSLLLAGVAGVLGCA